MEKWKRIKKIALYLDYDVKEKLANEELENPCQNNMTYQDICKEIDELMVNKYKDPSNYQNINYKKAAKTLSEYFDNIGEKEAEKYFPLTFSIKENIAYNVIYDEKTCKNFADLEKSYNLNDLSILSNNSEVKNIIKKLINNEKISSNFIKFEKELNENMISLISDNLEIKNLMENIAKNENI